MRIGIFGGTFDPIHEGHLRAAAAFLHAVAPDALFLVPNRETPRKRMPNASAADRLAMTRLAVAADPRFDARVSVSDCEITRAETSYTADTVALFSEGGKNEIFLYCGTDTFRSIDRFVHAEELLRAVTLVLGAREEATEAERREIAEKKAELTRRYGTPILGLPLVPAPLSSAQVREAIARGDDVSAMLPASVIAYIKEKKLYL